MNISFGKTPIFRCTMERQQDGKKSEATLYKMDPYNMQDLAEIQKSPTAGVMAYDFERSPFLMSKSGADFYILQDNESREVISAAETTHHYKRGQGTYTFVNEMAENRDYAGAIEPMTAHIVSQAFGRFDDGVIISPDTDVSSSAAENIGFSENGYDGSILPCRKFASIPLEIGKKYNIEYLA